MCMCLFVYMYDLGPILLLLISYLYFSNIIFPLGNIQREKLAIHSLYNREPYH